MRCRRVLVAGAVLLFAAGCGGGGGGSSSAPTPEAAMTIALSSPAFGEGGTIPRKYTCDGADVSPPLRFDHVPAGSAELALSVEDPDAPSGTFVHWLAWGLDPAQPALAEGEPAPIAGTNGFGSRSYRGPCPPAGAPHRYVFTVYALDSHLDLPVGASAKELRAAVHGHELGQGRLTGRYGR